MQRATLVNVSKQNGE